ncbi:hypothetical protein [Paenibacillus sp. GCM10012303]|uniref:hypothetical protein n=1 Tax=Paenibacillus sp. GCM10012303 TaxID=3317340 RepID=UPI003607AD9C
MRDGGRSRLPGKRRRSRRERAERQVRTECAGNSPVQANHWQRPIPGHPQGRTLVQAFRKIVKLKERKLNTGGGLGSILEVTILEGS